MIHPNCKLILVYVFGLIFLFVGHYSFAEFLKPNTYFYPEGANEYFIELLKAENIPHEIDYDKNQNIKGVSWDVQHNRAALEQALKVNHKIGATKSPESIKMLSPEMNDRFEILLKENNIPFKRKSDATYYDWEDWVDVQILKRIFWEEELNKISA